MPKTSFQRFEVNWSERLLIGDHAYPQSSLAGGAKELRAGPKSATLVMHGAGVSHRGLHAQFRAALSERGVATSAFDFVGHGETGGQLDGSSLLGRTQQALAVLRAECAPGATLIASSMAAYTAIRCSAHFPVSALVLMVPGVYHPEAYEVPFGPEFSAILRRPRSWEQSDAWQLLAKFRGDVLVISAERDSVIPAEIPALLYSSAAAARSRRHLVVPEAPHSLLKYLQNFPERFAALANEVAAFLGTQLLSDELTSGPIERASPQLLRAQSI